MLINLLRQCSGSGIPYCVTKSWQNSMITLVILQGNVTKLPLKYKGKRGLLILTESIWCERP